MNTKSVQVKVSKIPVKPRTVKVHLGLPGKAVRFETIRVTVFQNKAARLNKP